MALHPTCSTIKMGLQTTLKAIAETCAERVVVPAQVHCCGWSGDRGFTYPELNASALQDLRNALPVDRVSGYSASRTCEIGLSFTVTGITGRSCTCWTDARRPKGPL